MNVTPYFTNFGSQFVMIENPPYSINSSPTPNNKITIFTSVEGLAEDYLIRSFSLRITLPACSFTIYSPDGKSNNSIVIN